MGQVRLARCPLLPGVIVRCELPGLLNAGKIVFGACFAHCGQQTLETRVVAHHRERRHSVYRGTGDAAAGATEHGRHSEWRRLRRGLNPERAAHIHHFSAERRTGVKIKRGGPDFPATPSNLLYYLPLKCRGAGDLVACRSEELKTDHCGGKSASHSPAASAFLAALDFLVSSVFCIQSSASFTSAS